MYGLDQKVLGLEETGPLDSGAQYVELLITLINFVFPLKFFKLNCNLFGAIFGKITCNQKYKYFLI